MEEQKNVKGLVNEKVTRDDDSREKAPLPRRGNLLKECEKLFREHAPALLPLSFRNNISHTKRSGNSQNLISSNHFTHFTHFKKTAFTLAEVLITLAIIGIVAAMTIPTLISKFNNFVNIIAWRKAYSLAANAFELMKTDNALTDYSERTFIDALAKYLRADKVCDANKGVEQGCIKEYKIYRHDGVTEHLYKRFDLIGGGCVVLRLNNGMYVCNDMVGTRGILLFDVNGDKKPNRIGYDIFAAGYDAQKYQILPADGSKEGWGAVNSNILTPTAGDGTCQDEDLGWGCSYYYIYNNK